jgi:hypothetical protein
MPDSLAILMAVTRASLIVDADQIKVLLYLFGAPIIASQTCVEQWRCAGNHRSQYQHQTAQFDPPHPFMIAGRSTLLGIQARRLNG